MAATDWLRRLKAFVGGLAAGGSVVPPAMGATLPEDRAEALIHSYDGGGVKADGPAFLVRKSLADKVSFSGQYYVDAVSNASIDVVTTASPFKETRKSYTLGADTVVRDATLSVSMDKSSEPDYKADTWGLDITQDTFGGMTTVALGFSRGRDDVGKKDIGFFDKATHWQYRAGVTQILSPRWLASLNFEAVSDEGYLGSPYRAARVFGALIPERVPRTRSGRAFKLRAAGDIGGADTRTGLHAEWRHYWDNWDIKSDTLEVGGSKYFGESWLADGWLRYYKQGKALFYSDNAPAESLYVSRNRQLSTFHSVALGARGTWTPGGSWAKYGLKLNASYELRRFSFSDFTDLRTQKAYSYDANIVQLYVTAAF